MEKKLTIFRLQKLSDNIENQNWYKGYLHMETPEGNVMVEISHRHKVWWLKEFELTDDAFNILIG